MEREPVERHAKALRVQLYGLVAHGLEAEAVELVRRAGVGVQVREGAQLVPMRLRTLPLLCH